MLVASVDTPREISARVGYCVLLWCDVTLQSLTFTLREREVEREGGKAVYFDGVLLAGNLQVHIWLNEDLY